MSTVRELSLGKGLIPFTPDILGLSILALQRLFKEGYAAVGLAPAVLTEDLQRILLLAHKTNHKNPTHGAWAPLGEIPKMHGGGGLLESTAATIARGFQEELRVEPSQLKLTLKGSFSTVVPQLQGEAVAICPVFVCHNCELIPSRPDTLEIDHSKFFPLALLNSLPDQILRPRTKPWGIALQNFLELAEQASLEPKPFKLPDWSVPPDWVDADSARFAT